MSEQEFDALFCRIWQALCELEGRDSPEDDPDAIITDEKELRGVLYRQLMEFPAASALVASGNQRCGQRLPMFAPGERSGYSGGL